MTPSSSKQVAYNTRKQRRDRDPLRCLLRAMVLPRLVAIACVVLAAFAGTAHAASFAETGFSETDVQRPDGAATWNEAVGLTFSASGRMFVWERPGRVWIVDAGNPVPTPFLNISDEVLAWRDHGMLGFALDPGFELNGYIYVLYAVDPYHLFNCDSPAVGAPQCAASYDATTSWFPSDPASPGYRKATIGRVARYTAIKPAGDADFRRASQVDYSSRRVLLGETLRTQPKSTGIPLLFESHGVGSLLFGQDGSLLVSAGDGASYVTKDTGSASESFYQNALTDGIIRAAENVGSLRSQLVDSLSGKILRINPANGDAYPSNPFYDASAPRAARSRVWARGFRNPYRITLRPDSGSHSPAVGNPGVIVVGDVGADTREELNVVDVAGGNYGWPFYEGLTANPFGAAANVLNTDAPNPLFGTGGCTQQYFRFADLIVQDSFAPVPLTNPCNTAQQIPTSARPARHMRPVLDWPHDAAQQARWAAFAADGSASALPLGTASPGGSVVTGTTFSGVTATAGMFFRGTDFPAAYSGRFLLGDYGGQWIRSLDFSSDHRLLAVRPFASGVGGVVAFGDSDLHEGFYYITWTSFVRHVTYDPPGGRAPVVVLAATPTTGSSPLTVNFSSAGSSDPDGGALTYAWAFGDGTTSTAANPQHVYTAPSSAPINFDATLTVRDAQGLQTQKSVRISLGNTAPSARITSPLNGSTYPVPGSSYAVQLRADIADAQSPNSSLQCQWQPVLYHNAHSHSDPFINGCDAQTTITPVGCDGQQYSYGFRLVVTDPEGLTASDEVRVYPECPGNGADITPPTAPTGLGAAALGTTQIRVSWSAASDAGSGVAGYRVLRNGTQVGTTTSNVLGYTDTALSPGTAYTYTIVAIDNASPANVSAPSAAITVSTGSTVLRVKAGGGAFTDSQGQVWAADSGFNTGQVSAFNQPIAGTVEDGLYQSERYDVGSAPELQYAFALPNGSYQVRLHFAENWATAAGVRVFDVDIEGVRRFEDIDIYAEAGWRTSLVKTANVSVLDGQLNIGFVHQADNPLINAIEVVGLGTVIDTTAPTAPSGLKATPQSTTQIQLAWNASSDGEGTGVAGYRVLRDGVLVATTAANVLTYTDGSLASGTAYTYTVVAFDNASPANVSAPSAAVTASPASLVLRIRAGGGAFTDSQGQLWAADTGYNTGQTSSFNQPIAGTVEDALYQSERYDTSAAPDLEYGIALAPGNYLVRLHFAENWATSANQRVFDVDMEGVRRFDDIDVYAQAGWRTALVRSATLLVLDGQLNIRFVRQAGDPLINAIEVVGIGPPVDNVPPTVPTGLTATTLSTSQIRLNWSGSTDIDGLGMAGYRVLRDGLVVGSTPAGTLTYTDASLAPNTLYSYTVAAFDNASPTNVSAPSTAATARTLAPDTTPPAVVTGLAAAALSTTQIRLAWNATSDTGGSGLAGYRVLRDGVVVGTTAAGTLGYTDGSLSPGTTYLYAVVAFDGATPPNVSAAPAAVPATTLAPDLTPPTVPTGLTASALGATQIRLAWNASTDAGTGVAGYRVLRNGVQVGTTTAITLSYTDSGLTANTAYSYTVIAFDNATPANASAPSAALSASTASMVLRVKAGGGAFTDSLGQVWAADSGYNTGNTSTFNQPIAATVEDGLYQSERWDDGAAPELQYAFTVPNGRYEVRLHFAENWATAAGARVFDVDVEGVRRFEDIDIYAQAGWRTALVKSVNVFVLDGQLNIGFVHQADNPLVNAIEIIGLGAIVDTTPPTAPSGLGAVPLGTTQIRLAWNASSDGEGTGVAGYRVLRNGVQVGSTTGALGWTDSNLAPDTPYTYTIVAFDSASPANVSSPSAAVTASTASTVLRINAGGGGFTDSAGQAWSADSGFNTGNTSAFSATIAGTSDPTLYQSERYDTASAPDLEYAIPLPSGTYHVRLHFAENWATAPNQRVFGVDMEGIRRFDNVDVYAQAGWRTALIRSVTLIVIDGQLNIRFVRQVGDPLVNAIEVIGMGAAVDNTPPTVPTGLTATTLSTQQVRLNWNAATDIDGMGVGGYRVLRNGTQVGTTGAAVLTFTDTALTPATAYTYTVTAFDNASPANVSAPSVAASATTLAPDTIAPSVPTGLVATALNTTQIRLNWNASTDTGGSGLAGYRVLRGGVVVGTTVAGTQTYTDSALAPNTAYSYTVVAYDNGAPANVSLPSVAAVTSTLAPDLTAPTVPSGLSAVALGTSQIWLSWNASTDAGTGVGGYRVLRNGVTVGTTTALTLSFTDSGLTPNTAYLYSVVAFDNATPANVSLASAALSASTASTMLRMRAGGGAYTDAQGQVWAADANYNTGNTSTFNQPIAGTNEDALYQSERYDPSQSPDLEYSIPVPVGNYQVRLHFAENWATSAGSRVFDVDIEGVRRFEDIDVFGEAGYRTALVKTATLVVFDGQLNIRFLHQAGDPLINAIEVMGLGPIVDNTPPTVPTGVTATALSGAQVRVAWNASTDLEGYGVSGYRVLRNGVQVGTTNAATLGYTDSGLVANTVYSYTVVAFDGASPANASAPSAAASATTPSLVIRNRAGGGEFTDSLGRTWAADSGFNTGQVATFNQPIAGTVEDPLYQSERYDTGDAPDLQYGFNVPNGNYSVRLHFAENWATNVGQRTFDVDIENIRRFDNVDVFREAGYRTALVKTVGVYVADNQLTIRFGRRNGDPVINAIEVLGLAPIADNSAPTVPTGVVATALSSTHMRLSWNASSDGEGTGVAGYRVLRNGVIVGTAPVGTTSFIDSGLTANTAYNYTVAAFDYASPVNVSAQSVVVSATSGPVEPPDITSSIAPPHSGAMVNRQAENYLRVNGTRLTTASGQNVQLRGLNIGGWLVTESWMNGFSDWSDESGTQHGRSAIFTLESRFGAAAAAELMGIWQDHWMTTRDMDRIRDAGFNVIRVPFSYRTLQKADNSWNLDQTGRIDFSRMDWIVRESAARGIFVIFDLHIWPGQRYDYENIGRSQNQSIRTQMANLWEVIAAHYRGNGTVAAFDLINELAGGWGVHQQMVAAIRRGDPSRVVVVEGFNYNEFRPLYDQGVFPNSVYSQHYYDFWGDPGVSSWDFQNRLQSYNNPPLPVYIGEFLADDFGTSARYMNANNISWSSWTYKTVGMTAWGMVNYHNWLRTDLQRDSFETIRNRWMNDFTAGDVPGGTPNFTINQNIRGAP